MPFADFQNGIEAYDGTPTGDAGLALNKDLKTIAQHIEVIEEALFRYAGLSLKDRLYKGVWNSGTGYVANDVVRHKNGVYVTSGSSTGNDPTAGSPWTLLSVIGLDNTGVQTSGDNTLRTLVTFDTSTPAVVTLDSSVSLGAITFNTGTDRQEVMVWLKGTLTNEPTYTNGTATGDTKDFSINDQIATWRFSTATSKWHLVRDNPFNQSLNSSDGVSFSEVSATYFYGGTFTGDGTGLTLSNYFDQNLNTTDCPTFNCVTAYVFYGGNFSGNGTGLTLSNYFDQYLNTTSCPTFSCLTLDNDSSDMPYLKMLSNSSEVASFGYSTNSFAYVRGMTLRVQSQNSDLDLIAGNGNDVNISFPQNSVLGHSFRTGHQYTAGSGQTFTYFTVTSSSTQAVEILWTVFNTDNGHSVAGRRLFAVKCTSGGTVTLTTMENSKGGESNDVLNGYDVSLATGANNSFYVYGSNAYNNGANWSYTAIRNRF